jgi:hypothetical protein
MGRQQYGLTGVYNATALTLADQEGAAVALDAKGNTTISPVPAGATLTTQSSGNVANATAAATLTGAVGKTTYITGFSVTGSGATVGLPVSVTITGLLGGTATFTYTASVGALVPNTPLVEKFIPPMPSSTTNTNIVVSCPALGAGNTNNTTVVTGYTI